MFLMSFTEDDDDVYPDHHAFPDKDLECFLVMIAKMKGALVITKFITRNSKDSYCVRKASLGSLPAALRT